MNKRNRTAIERLESAACNLARSRAHAAGLWARMVAMPPCSVVAAWEARVKAYCGADGPEAGEQPAACHRAYEDRYEGARPRPGLQWCDECLARQPLFESVLAERRKWGGYMRAILAAARQLDRGDA